jgi:hypothetical protein
MPWRLVLKAEIKGDSGEASDKNIAAVEGVFYTVSETRRFWRRTATKATADPSASLRMTEQMEIGSRN